MNSARSKRCTWCMRNIDVRAGWKVCDGCGRIACYKCGSTRIWVRCQSGCCGNDTTCEICEEV